MFYYIRMCDRYRGLLFLPPAVGEASASVWLFALWNHDDPGIVAEVGLDQPGAALQDRALVKTIG